MSEDVRSTNGRPSASTPVVTSGTACTMRVLRRFLNSVFALAASSDTISALSSAKLLPGSFIQAAAVPQIFQLCASAWQRRHGFETGPYEVPSEVGLRCAPVRNIHTSFAT